MARKTRMQVMTLLLVMTMFALVDISAERELLFPEIAALALGFWVMARPPWTCSPFALWASPTLAAFSGVLLLRYLHLPLLVLIGCAFALVVLQLKLLRSTVFPSISAAILPLITGTTDWLYPLSVSLLMFLIVCGKQVAAVCPSSHQTTERVPAGGQRRAGRGSLSEPVYWGKLLVGVLAVAALAVWLGGLFMLAPPLIVAFVEISRPDQAARRTPLRTVLLLALSAGAGSLWLYLVGSVFHGPLWLFSGLALATVFLLFAAMRMVFPPAAAIALLPALVPAGCLWTYPLHVLLGSALFVFLGIISFKTADGCVPGALASPAADG